MTIKRVSKVLDGKLNTSNTPNSPYRPSSSEALLTEGYEAPAQKRPWADSSVDLSEAAKLRSQQGRKRSMQDIEDSDLPESIKELLMELRHNKQLIIRKISELQAMKSNARVRAHVRRQRMDMLQTEIMALETSYKQELKHLDAMMTQMQMPNEQADVVATLLMN